MGLFQKFKDYMWISECHVWMTEYAPRQSSTANLFCKQFKEHLLEERTKGLTPHVAIMDCCVLLINSIADHGFESWDLEMVEFRKMAYEVGYGCLNRWPRIELSNDYAVQLFMAMARIDDKIWESPLARNMGDLLSARAG